MVSRFGIAIQYSFYILFFFVPLILYPKTYELFEFNKIVFVYLMTAIIVTFWLLKAVEEKRFHIQKTPFDLPLILFLAANILSTVFSIDQHTSLFGYYSRFNGGLLSTISYIVLFYALVSNLKKEDVLKIVYVTLSSSIIVAVWGVLQHWGIDEDYWADDVRSRVFSTLGQANWLAAFLGMVMPFNLALIFLNKDNRLKLLFLGIFVISLMSFTFTYSRGGTIGVIIGLGIFLTYLTLTFFKNKTFKNRLPWISVILAIALLVNLFWGNAFFRDSTFSKLWGSQYKDIENPVNLDSTNPISTPSGTQLESGGTESGQIRLIVWKGALDILKNFPVLGTGVETFAYSYAQFRPEEHNLTSEWDYVYNKAHNEYLNYLATTGLVGAFAYLFLILRYITFFFTQIKNQNLLGTAFFSSYVVYLVQNFFLFSVVPISLLFYTIPALHFLAVKDRDESLVEFDLRNFFQTFQPYLTYAGKTLTICFFLVSLISISRYWLGDRYFNDGFRTENYFGYLKLKNAASINPVEPFYKAELGYAASSLAPRLEDKEEGSKMAQEALNQGKKALEISPNNLSYWKTMINIYNNLIPLDDKYLSEAIRAAEKASKLAPTEAKVHYNLAILYAKAGLLEKAEKTLSFVIKIKNDYREAHFLLARVYYSQGKRDLAVSKLKEVTSRFTDYKEAHEKLNEWVNYK